MTRFPTNCSGAGIEVEELAVILEGLSIFYLEVDTVPERLAPASTYSQRVPKLLRKYGSLDHDDSTSFDNQSSR